MNWGKSLLLIILVFCTFLIYSTYKIYNQVRTDLVTQLCSDHLESCEHRYIAMLNTKKDKSFRVANTEAFVVVELPKISTGQSISGEILFYCPYNAELDKRIQVVLDGHRQQIIPRSWLQGKAYIIKLGWKDHNEMHYDEKYIFLN